MTKMHKAPMASCWLLASADHEARLIDEIEGLAARHGTPVFHPHLTILGDVPRDPSELAPALRGLAASVPAFSAPVTDIVLSDAFFRSYYAAFPPVPELLRLRELAGELFEMEPGPFVPHVSLLYGPVEPVAKAASRVETAARHAGRVVRFDRIALTNSANEVPIADWRCVDIVALGAA
jgi:2'-5' RNA ligase